jgi:hypothetical protein
MGFFDKVVGGIKNSGIPGYSQAAGIFSGVTGVGADPDAPPPPEYTPYSYNEKAFGPSFEENLDKMQLSNNATAALRQNAGQTNAAGFNEALGEQRAAMLGQKPSLAEMQMQEGMRQNAQGLQSAAGSARGANSMALAQMNAANQMSTANQNMNNQAAMLRAKEQEQARQGMFGAISSDRAANVAGYNAQQQAFLGSMGQMGQRDQFNRQSAIRLDENRANQEAMRQGRQQSNWSNQQAAAAQEDANDRQQAQGNQQTAVNALQYLKK